MIVYHRPHQKSTGNVAQKREFIWLKLCATFLLTNCWGCGIMEIPAPTAEGAALKFWVEKATPFGMALGLGGQTALDFGDGSQDGNEFAGDGVQFIEVGHETG